MRIKGTVAFVTGANRGIGRRVVDELRLRGARRIYAAARSPAALADTLVPGQVEPVQLDITDAGAVERAARQCADVQLLINNAGVNRNCGFISAPDLSAARAEIETNYFGSLSMCRAFAPVLAGNGGGVIVNVLSILAKIGLPAMGSLCASKAAGLRMTECLRAELASRGIRVLAFLPAAVDTDMTRGFDRVSKESPAGAARALCEGVERETPEIPFGARAEYVLRMLRDDPQGLMLEYSAMLPR
jgi:NAD(P)-dependent dehydrogenase (short-subunit alcohol dehydrogenase family)